MYPEFGIKPELVRSNEATRENIAEIAFKPGERTLIKIQKDQRLMWRPEKINKSNAFGTLRRLRNKQSVSFRPDKKIPRRQ